MRVVKDKEWKISPLEGMTIEVITLEDLFNEYITEEDLTDDTLFNNKIELFTINNMEILKNELPNTDLGANSMQGGVNTN